MLSNMALIKICYTALYGSEVCTREGFYKAYAVLSEKHNNLRDKGEDFTRMLHLALIHLGFDTAVEVARSAISCDAPATQADRAPLQYHLF